MSEPEPKETTRRDRIRRWVRRLVLTGLGIGLLGAVALAQFLYWTWRQLPPLDTLANYEPSLITKVYDRHGRLLAEYAAERRVIVPLEEMPPYLVRAFLAAEDDDFYEHFGIEPAGILRAAWANLVAGGVVQGGSTITQQVARTFFLTQRRRLMRKIKEILLALRLEHHLSKDEILFLYLNQIYLGRGAYGVGSAAELYFGKPVSALTLAEAAILAGLPPAPSAYAPHVAPEKARRRQLYVLRRLEQLGWITHEEAEAARKEEVRIRGWNAPFWQAPYAAEAVRQWLLRRFGEDLVLRGGLRVYTTFDLDAVAAAQGAVRGGLEALQRRQGYPGPVTHLERAAWPAWLAERGRDLAARIQQRLLGGVVALVGPRTYRLADTMPTLPKPVTALVDATDRFPALVTGIAVDGSLAWVDFGLGVARLPAAAMWWARVPDPQVPSGKVLVERVDERLRVGDVIVVRRLRPDPWAPEPVQARIEAALAATAPSDRPGALLVELFQEPSAEAALVSVLPDSGEIIAVVGGYDYKRNQFNRAFFGRRQPGSAFKPIVYTAALEEGYTPASILVDTPLVYESVEREFRWKPKNYEGRFYGPMTLVDALTYSRNVVTIQLVRDLGIARVIETARRLGIESPLPRNLSIALGSGEVTPLELSRAYATLANLGRRPELVYVREVWDATGHNVYKYVPPTTTPVAIPYDPFRTAPPPTPTRTPFRLRRAPEIPIPGDLAFPQVVSPPTAYQVVFLLRNVVERGTGWRARRLGRPVAGKTGTTNDNHDSWFVGFTPQVQTTVWVGFDRMRSLGRFETGSRAAAPIWVDYMQRILRGLPIVDFPIPEGIVFRRIDSKTGRPASPLSKEVLLMPFRPEQLEELERAQVDSGGSLVEPGEELLVDPEAW